MLFIMVTCCLYNDNSNKNTLNEIEEYIQDNPQKAYGELSKIDRSSLHGNKERALFFLLYSMALDKNYIDLKSDSLINNAVRYYSKRGDKLHRFYSYYYLGRVYSNAWEFNKSLGAFLNAEQCIDNSVPKDYQARLYFNKSRVYMYSFAGDKALADATRAKYLSKDLDNPGFYLACALEVSNLLFLKREYEASNQVLLEIKEWMDHRHIRPTIYYYQTCLRQSLVSQVSPDSIRTCFLLYEKACESTGASPDALLKTDYYLKIGDINTAIDSFQAIEQPTHDNYYEAVKYYNTKSNLYKSIGNIDEYMEADRLYQEAVESINLSVFNNDVRFLEERNNNEAEKEQSRKDRVILVIVLLMVLGASGGIGAMLYNKFKKSKRQLEDIRKEYNLITNIFNQTSLDTPESIRNVLDARIKALRPFITNVKFPLPKGRRILESIDDERRKMLTSIGMLYALSYPAFTTKLSQIGLRSEEIGLCSLYVCGYSSKEMNDLLNKTDIYHLNSGIRNKIGDEIGSKTLHIWLKELFHSCNS